MSLTKSLAVLLLGALTILPLGAGAGDGDKDVTTALTPKLRELLQQEMRHISGAMQSIYEGIITGDHARVAAKATAVHDSFILEQSLTRADRRNLVKAVPKDFVKRDKRFHATAAELVEAAQQEDTVAELARFQSMTRQCAGCHGRYLRQRFPGVTPPE